MDVSALTTTIVDCCARRVKYSCFVSGSALPLCALLRRLRLVSWCATHPVRRCCGATPLSSQQCCAQLTQWGWPCALQHSQRPRYASAICGLSGSAFYDLWWLRLEAPLVVLALNATGQSLRLVFQDAFLSVPVHGFPERSSRWRQAA